MKSFFGFIASILAVGLVSLLGLRLYGWRNHFPCGHYLATAEISLKERRAALIRRWGGDPKDPHYAAADIPCECSYHLGDAAGLYAQQLYPPEDISDMEERFHKWGEAHVKIEKVDEDTIRLIVSGNTAEEAENTLKQIMDLYLDRYARLQRKNGLPEGKLGLPTWSGKAVVTKR